MRRTIRYYILSAFILGVLAFSLNAQTLSWSGMKGPFAGSVQFITADRSGYVYVASDVGLQCSTDGGSSWQPAGNPFRLTYGGSFLFVDSLDNAYTGNITEGLFKTTDRGLSWNRTSLQGGAVCGAAISGGRVCIGGRQTVAISSDGGNTWSASQVTSSPVKVLAVAEDKSGDIYAGLQAVSSRNAPSYGGGVYISQDSGKTWQSCGMSLISVSGITVDGAGRIYILSDAGVLSAPPRDSNWTQDEYGIPDPSHALALMTDRSGEAVAVSDAGIAVRSAALQYWNIVAPAVSSSSITAGFYTPGGTSYAGTDVDGVFLLPKDSTSWSQCGIRPAAVTSIGFDKSWNLYVGTSDGVYRLESNTGRWIRNSNGLGHSTVYRIGYSPYNARMYAATMDGFYFQNSATKYWNPLVTQWSYNFIELPDRSIYVGTSGGIASSASGGGIWNYQLPVGLPVSSIYAIVADSSDNLYAATAYAGVFESTDRGNFWTQTGYSSPLLFYTVKSLAMDATGDLFAGTDTSGAFMMAEGGRDWTHIPSITGKQVTSFLLGNAYFAGTTDRGVFVSTDRGANWVSSNIGLADTSVSALAFDQNGNLYAGTAGGLFRSSGVIDGVHASDVMPASFFLRQNYPNPFNPTTVVSYELPTAAFVELKVYDVLGRDVATLVDGVQRSGSHQVVFDGSKLPSGVYFCRLASLNQSRVMKMVLVK